VKTLLQKLRVVLDRRTKLGLLYGTVGSAAIAALDMLAIALVLPLVNLAADSGGDHAVVRWLAYVIGTDNRQTLTLWVAGFVVGLFILKDLLSVFFVWWMAGFKAFNRVTTSSHLLRYYLRAPYTETSARSSADLMRTMGDGVIQVYGSVAFGLMNIIASSLSILAICFALVVSAPVPTVALLAYLGFASVLYLRVMRPRMQRAGEVSVQAAADAWRSALGALGGRKESKLRSSEEFFVEKYREASLRGAVAGRHAEFMNSLPRYILEILFIVAIGVILVANTVLAGGAGGFSGGIGMLALFVAAGFRVLPTITVLIGAISNLRFGMPYLDLVHEDMTTMDELPPRRESQTTMTFNHELRLENLSFRYPGSDRRVLDHVNLTIPQGSSVAFVGSSGAGKTTLVDVLLGLHVPEEGRLLVDGADAWDDIGAWQKNLGYVPQDVFLLDATLAENIAFDQDLHDIDLDRLQRSIDGAQLRELVEDLPEGVHTHLRERGSRLSGGQRQRVGIARALYREPSVLVLDEATSALDNETEHSVSAAIHALTGSLTVVIVAHRLSTVKDADQVVLMNDGRIEAAGSFHSVRVQSERFSRMVRLGALDA
jgi:ABC-type multidrug transport system fused ATPase/permease subunit